MAYTAGEQNGKIRIAQNQKQKREPLCVCAQTKAFTINVQMPEKSSEMIEKL